MKERRDSFSLRCSECPFRKERIMELSNPRSELIEGLRIEESFGRHRFACKVGGYIVFGQEQASNQVHRHGCHELCLIVEGCGRFVRDGESHLLRQGDLILADPGIVHEIQADPLERLLLLYLFIEITTDPRIPVSGSFGDRCLDGFLAGHREKATDVRLLSYLSFIEAYNTPRRSQRYGTREAVRNLVLESLQLLGDHPDGGMIEPSGSLLEKALDYVDANLHLALCVRDVAIHCSTTQRNLEYLFRRHLDTTVLGHVHVKKAALACHYLGRQFSVAETASMVGIPSPPQFSAMFSRIMHMPPSQYRREHREEGIGIGRRL